MELFHPEWGSMQNEEYERWKAYYAWEAKKLEEAIRRRGA